MKQDIFEAGNYYHIYNRGNNKEKKGIHFNKEMTLRYKQKHQRLFEEKYGHEMFMQLIGRNYL